jgi:ABC-type sugar transport system ATPase subunit
MTAIAVEHLHKFFTDDFNKMTTALDDINLRLSDGERLAILGPSGCGKSTLLRCIAGLMTPDSGRILYDGVPVSEVDRDQRNIGMVFQEGALIPHWEARRSVGFFLALRKRADEVPERVHRISKITGFGLDVLLDRTPNKLSGGEKQRVSIARALTRDLNLLLMDEPFANIDAKLRSQARVELKRLMNEFPVTSIYVTHDQIEAVALSERVAVMREGKIVQVGSYEQLYTQPINRFVAEFIGTQPINLFNGFVIDHRWKGDTFGGFPIRRDLDEGARIVMGIRPEHIELASSSEETVVGFGEGTVQNVTPYFAEQHQLLEVYGNGESWLMHAPLDFKLQYKDRIRCHIPAERIIFFDRETGTRVG